ncbi:MAG: arylesterase [Rhodothermales bacterium]|nr:arylesterase [Rhodothermales bacterium]
MRRTNRPLYPLLLSWVLLLAACGGEPEPSEPDPGPGAEARTDAAAPPPPATPDGTLRVLVLGNSIAAGYGLDLDQAFPALLQQKADALGWPVDVQNAGVSGETTAGGLRRIGWLLRDRVDVLILELGGNDGLRGTDLGATKRNLQAIIDTTRARYPEAAIVLAGMQVPPNLGPQYTARFRDLYPELAAENDAALIPFLLEGVGGIASLNLPDGIHPTAEGHRIVADNVWRVLRPVLEERLAEPAQAGG